MWTYYYLDDDQRQREKSKPKNGASLGSECRKGNLAITEKLVWNKLPPVG